MGLGLGVGINTFICNFTPNCHALLLFFPLFTWEITISYHTDLRSYPIHINNFSSTKPFTRSCNKRLKELFVYLSLVFHEFRFFLTIFLLIRCTFSILSSNFLTVYEFFSYYSLIFLKISFFFFFRNLIFLNHHQ